MYSGNNQDHVNIVVFNTEGAESEYTGNCNFVITPDEVVTLLENAIQNVAPDLTSINNTITDVLRNIDDANAPTFHGEKLRFCYTSFLNLLKNRVLRAGGRTYTIGTIDDYDSDLEEEITEDEDFGEFLADQLHVELNQPGADILASFVDLCI